MLIWLLLAAAAAVGTSIVSNSGSKKSSGSGTASNPNAPTVQIPDGVLHLTNDLQATIKKIADKKKTDDDARKAKVKSTARGLATLATIALPVGAPVFGLVLTTFEGLMALGDWLDSRGDDPNDQGWIDNANRLFAEQTKLGFIPGSFLGTVNGEGGPLQESEYFSDAESYAKSLGEFGLSRLDAITPAARDAILEFGRKTLQVAYDPQVQAIAERIANSIYGTLYGEDISGFLRNHYYPSLMAGTVAGLVYNKNVARAQALAINSFQSYWAGVPFGDTPPDSHLYALANAWNAAKNYK